MVIFLAIVPLFAQVADYGVQRPIDLTFAAESTHDLDISKKEDIWQLTIKGNDPYISFREQGFTAQKSDVIQIRYKSVKAYDAQLYWSTNKQERLIENNFQLNSTEVPGTGSVDWATCEVPIGRLSGAWSGTITGLRLDPASGNQTGKVEVAWVRIISRPGESLNISNLPPPSQNEFVSEVQSGIVPGSGIRYLENRRFRIETNEASLHLQRIAAGREPQPIANISAVFDKTDSSAILDTRDFPTNNLFCKFRDRWRTQILSLLYNCNGASEQRVETQMDVALESRGGPFVRMSPSGNLIVTPAKGLKELVVPEGSSTPVAEAGKSTAVKLQKTQSLTLNLNDGTQITLRFEKALDREAIVSDTGVSVHLSENEYVSIGTGERSRRAPIAANERPALYRMLEPRTVTLDTGITVVDASVELTSGRPGARPRVVTSPIAFRTIISSDFIDVNLPVDVSEVKIEVPKDAKVTAVRDAMTFQDISYNLEGSQVVLKAVPACTVRIKCDRLLDYRVMFTGSCPIKPNRFYEDLGNYYYPQWLFFWEPQIDKWDIVNHLDKIMQDRPLPIFLGLHYGSHAPPNFYDTLYRLHPDVKQVDNRGNPHKGLADGGFSPPWMCLVHPALRQEIQTRLDRIFGVVQEKPWYNRIFAYSSTSEPWIVTGFKDPDEIYCYNPEHIKWFQQFEKNKWNGDLAAFNSTFGTRFASWDEVDPPRKIEQSAYYNEWLLSKVEAVIDSEVFYRGEIFKHDPKRPNYAHMAIMVCYNQIRNSNTPDVMHVGKDTNPDMFKEGGSLYATEPMLQAFSADSVRAYDPDEVSFPEAHGSKYNQMYSYLVGSSGLFKKSFSLMVHGTTWGAGNVGNAWQVFAEMMSFLCLDLGEVSRPDIGITFDLISDNNAILKNVHTALFEKNIDRCVITTRMIEHGYLKTHPLKMLIFPDIIMLSEKAIAELAAASAKGLKVVIFGDFAKTDYYYKASDEFTRNRDIILKQSIRPGSTDELAEMVSPVLNTNVPEKLIAYRKSKGFTLYNMWANKIVDVEVPEEMRSGRLAVVNDTGQVVQLRNAGASIKVPLEAMRAGSVVLCR